MRSRRPLAFTPSTSPALEERVVLSESGLLGPAVVQAATPNPQTDEFRFPTELPERSELLNELEARMNTLFATFAEDFRIMRSTFFEDLGNLMGNPGDSDGDDTAPIDLRAEQTPMTPETLVASFHQAVLERVGELRDEVGDTLDDVQGGAGLLTTFARARVEQLGQELLNIPAPGIGPLNEAEYVVLGEYAIADALSATKQFINVYDAAIFQTASGFFSANLRFFRGGQRPAEQISDLSPAVGPVLDGLNGAFSAFATDVRDHRSAYLNALDPTTSDGAFDAFRGQVAERADVLRTEAIDAINEPAGGGGLLNVFVTEQLNALQRNLANVPSVGSTPFEPLGFSLLNEQVIGRSLNDMRATVQLYDNTLATTARRFFDAHARFAGMGRPGQGLRTQTAPMNVPGTQTAAQTAGEANAAQHGGGLVGGGFGPGGLVGLPGFGVRPGLGGSPFSPGTPVQPFFGPRPAGFDPALGFGGLGGGFTGFGRPVNFGTGFGFGGTTFPGLGPAGSLFGQSLGFGTPTSGFGLGNSFGVVAGPGIGVGRPAFGGFFL